jgi:hypothetical protein
MKFIIYFILIFDIFTQVIFLDPLIPGRPLLLDDNIKEDQRTGEILDNDGDAMWAKFENIPTSIKSSSTLNGGNYNVYNIYDNNYKTAWVEGIIDYGIGEWIEYQFSTLNDSIEGIEFCNGYVKNKKTFKENSRVKKMKMYLNGKPYAIINLEDTYATQLFYFDDLIKSDLKNIRIKFEILEVYPGTKYKDTCISELRMIDVGMCFPKSSKVKMSDNTYKNIEDLQTGDKILSYDEKN